MTREKRLCEFRPSQKQFAHVLQTFSRAFYLLWKTQYRYLNMGPDNMNPPIQIPIDLTQVSCGEVVGVGITRLLEVSRRE